uniref:TM2 domain containing 2 n=1 Tax=Mus musculus TaxID=10090 RepID=A0A1B0GSV8_MOUSE
MVLGGCPVSYLLLCGQAALLLGNLLLLHCVSRSHSFNATAELDLTPSGAAHLEGPAASSWEYSDPNSPVILCSYLPDEFVDCDAPVDHVGNATASQELGYGCLKVRILFFVQAPSWEAWPGAVKELQKGIQTDLIFFFFFYNFIRITVAGNMTKVLTAEEHICFPQEPTMPVPKPPKCKDQPVLLPLTVETNKLKPRHRLYFQSKAFLNRAAATTAKPCTL